MKLTMEQIFQGENEIIIRYREMNKTLQTLVEIVHGESRKIVASENEKIFFLLPEEILYIESVDGVTFAYTHTHVFKLYQTLKILVETYSERGFFRCSKSMILNIYKISYLKSEPYSRIRATMENGEQVIISRKYSGRLRQILQEEY